MGKIWTIGRTEFLDTVRSKGFLIGVFMMPILMGGSLLFQVFVKDRVDLSPRRAVVVDATGELFAPLEVALAERNESGIWSLEPGAEDKQVRPAFELEAWEPDASEGSQDPKAAREKLTLALSERVRRGELQGFFLIGSQVFNVDPPAAGSDASAQSADPMEAFYAKSVSYYTHEPTYRELSDWVSGVLNAEIKERRFLNDNLDKAVKERVELLSGSVPTRSYGLIEESSDGTLSGGQAENKFRTFAVPLACLMLLFMLVMTSAPQLMNNVLEEKMQRIAEVLVSAVTPFQLLMGKLVGGVMITLTLAATYMVGVVWASYEYGFAEMIPGSLYAWLLVMIVFALFMYGALFSALGAACSELRDAQSMMMPAMAMVLIPVFGFSVILENPNGTVAQILTFVPTCTPLILLFRLAAQPGPQTWEVVLGLIDCALTTLLLVWASAKIFRVGILSQGQAPSFRKLLGWLRQG